MTRRARALAVVAVAALSAAAGVLMQRHTQPAGSITPVTAEQGAAILALKLPDVGGETQPLAQWGGKVLVVNFWATWCPPCMKELPEFAATSRQYQAQPVQFVGIAIDRSENVRHFVSINPMPYPLLIGSPETLDLTASLGNSARALPFTAIFDTRGALRFVKLGTLNADELAGKIRALLDSP